MLVATHEFFFHVYLICVQLFLVNVIWASRVCLMKVMTIPQTEYHEDYWIYVSVKKGGFCL
jgi:hypothetical protein